MLLSGALLALFMTGLWLYCLTDAILTPASECRGLSKSAWIAVMVVTFVCGALAWLVVRRPPRDSYQWLTPNSRRGAYHGHHLDQRWTGADDAAARHPAGRAMVTRPQATLKGPDDDPEFLRALHYAIHGHRRPDGEA
jgi:hypothetical protein